jgi:hypothetical protein
MFTGTLNTDVKFYSPCWDDIKIISGVIPGAGGSTNSEFYILENTPVLPVKRKGGGEVSHWHFFWRKNMKKVLDRKTENAVKNVQKGRKRKYEWKIEK